VSLYTTVKGRERNLQLARYKAKQKGIQKTCLQE